MLFNKYNLLNVCLIYTTSKQVTETTTSNSYIEALVLAFVWFSEHMITPHILIDLLLVITKVGYRSVISPSKKLIGKKSFHPALLSCIFFVNSYH